MRKTVPNRNQRIELDRDINAPLDTGRSQHTVKFVPTQRFSTHQNERSMTMMPRSTHSRSTSSRATSTTMMPIMKTTWTTMMTTIADATRAQPSAVRNRASQSPPNPSIVVVTRFRIRQQFTTGFCVANQRQSQNAIGKLVVLNLVDAELECQATRERIA